MADATDQDVQEFAGGLPQGFLECRELGHAWRPHTASWNADSRSFDRTLRCTRCRTLRVEVLSPRGEVLSRHYVYPESYLAANLGRITGTGRDVLRRESLSRQLGDKNARSRLEIV